MTAWCSFSRCLPGFYLGKLAYGLNSRPAILCFHAVADMFLLLKSSPSQSHLLNWVSHFELGRGKGLLIPASPLSDEGG